MNGREKLWYKRNVKVLSTIQFPLRLRFCETYFCEMRFCEDVGFLDDTSCRTWMHLRRRLRPRINRVQFRGEVEKYYYFDAHERRTEGEKVLMTEYYAAECKNRR